MSDPLKALRALTGNYGTTSKGDLPPIPSVPASESPAVTNFLASIKSWIEQAAGQGVGGFVTKKLLAQHGVIRLDNGDVTFTNGPPNLALPPAPLGVTATGAMTNIILTWVDPATIYSNHGYAEVWASGDSSFTNAVLVSTSAGFIFAHAVGESSDRWYWVRFVSTSGVKGPFQGVDGVHAQTAENPAFLLSVLEGELTESQLNTDLRTKIALVPEMTENVLQYMADLDDVSDRVLFERAVTDATVSIHPTTGVITLNATSAITTNVEARLTQAEFDIDAVQGSVTGAVATLSSVQDDLTSAQSQLSVLSGQVAVAASTVYIDNAIESAIGGFTSDSASAAQRLAEAALRQSLGLDEVTDKDLVQRASVAVARQEISTNADAIEAEATARTTLAAAVSGNTAAIVSEQTARSTADSAIAESVTRLQATVDGNRAALVTDYYTKAQADSAISASTSTLQVGLAGVGVISMQDSAYVKGSTLTGLEAQKTVKIDNSGWITGYGLASTVVNGTPQSEFAIVADRFSIAPVATDNAADDGSPFFYRTVATTINGVSVPSGAYMKSAFIHDAAITNAKIANAAIDSAKIANAAIDSAKIADAAISTAKIGDAAITSAKIQDAAISTAKIGDAAITSAKIGTAAIQTAHIGDAQITSAKITSLEAGKVAAGTLSAGVVYAGSINASQINASTLSAVSANIGTVTAGILYNAPQTSYVNLNASGSAPFIKVGGALELRADGSGVFSRAILSAPNVIYSNTFDGISLSPNQWARIYIEEVSPNSGALSATGYANYFSGNTAAINAGGRFVMEHRIVVGIGFGNHSANFPSDSDGALLLRAYPGYSRVTNGSVYMDVRFVPIAGAAASVVITNIHVEILRT